MQIAMTIFIRVIMRDRRFPAVIAGRLVLIFFGHYVELQSKCLALLRLF